MEVHEPSGREDLLHLSGAATESERTGMSKAWFLREARERRLRHYRVGRRVLFDPRDTDARISAHEVPAREG